MLLFLLPLSISAQTVPLLDLSPEAKIQGDWKVVEEGLSVNPLKQSPAPPEPWGTEYISSSENGDGQWHDEFTGMISSPSFVVTDQFYEIRMCGGNKYHSAYLMFLDESGEEVWRITGENSTDFQTRFVDLEKAIGRRVTMQLVDQDTGGWGHIRFAGLRVADQDEARSALVDFHLNLLRYKEARFPASIWLRLNIRPEHIEAINQGLRTGSDSQIQELIWVLRDLDFENEGTVEALLEIAKTKHERIASYALIALSEITVVDVPLEPINNLLRFGPTRRMRRFAADTLGRLNKPQGDQFLAAQLLVEKDEKVWGRIRRTIDSQHFTRTELPPVKPGEVVRGWLDGSEFAFYLPKNWTPNRQWPVVAVVHGTFGHGFMYSDLVRGDADKYGFVVICPTFDTTGWWDFGKFGVICASKRSDLHFWRIVDGLAPRFSLDASSITMYGHSEGGQFVHRMAMLYPNRVHRAVSGSAQLLAPDANVMFPLGTGVSPLCPDLKPNPKALLNGRYAQVLGALEGEWKINLVQGWVDQMNSLAEESSIDRRIKLFVVDGVGHSGHGNYFAIRDWLYQDFQGEETNK